MTKQQILETVKENMKETYKYDTLDHLKKSDYYVECVKREIGKVAFMNDYELTIGVETELVEKFFN